MTEKDPMEEMTVTIRGRLEYLIDFTDVREDQLSEEFSRQASLLAYVSHAMVEAESEHAAAKTHREFVEAEADAQCREILDEKGVKYTEAKIRGMVVMDEARLQAVTTEARALEAYKKLKVLADAMRQKGDMLISLGALVRAEADLTGATIKQTLTDLRS